MNRIWHSDRFVVRTERVGDGCSRYPSVAAVEKYAAGRSVWQLRNCLRRAVLPPSAVRRAVPLPCWKGCPTDLDESVQLIRESAAVAPPLVAGPHVGHIQGQCQISSCRCAGGQVFSGRLAELGQELHPTLMGVFQRLAKGAVWPEVSLDESVLDPHGGIEYGRSEIRRIRPTME